MLEQTDASSGAAANGVTKGWEIDTTQVHKISWKNDK